MALIDGGFAAADLQRGCSRPRRAAPRRPRRRAGLGSAWRGRRAGGARTGIAIEFPAGSVETLRPARLRRSGGATRASRARSGREDRCRHTITNLRDPGHERSESRSPSDGDRVGDCVGGPSRGSEGSGGGLGSQVGVHARSPSGLVWDRKPVRRPYSPSPRWSAPQPRPSRRTRRRFGMPQLSRTSRARGSAS